jgi:cob(I)alamin adenosyltransferase
MAIYTRKGDKGKTFLSNGQKVPKFDPRIEIYGTIDELNSIIGVVLSSKHQALAIKKELIKIQNDLFEIGSRLVLQGETLQNLQNLNKRVEKFEDFIDKMTLQMPRLNNFILPGGGKTGAMLHFARAVSRRLERKIIALDSKEKIDKNIMIYLNRLSDLLFTMARFANFKEKRKELIWSNKR